MAHSEPGTVTHGGQDDLTEALAVPRSVEECRVLPEVGGCPTIVALGLVSSAEVGVRQRLQADISAGGGEREGPLASSDGLVIYAPEVEMDCQKDRDLPKPAR